METSRHVKASDIETIGDHLAGCLSSELAAAIQREFSGIREAEADKSIVPSNCEAVRTDTPTRRDSQEQERAFEAANRVENEIGGDPLAY